MMKKKHGINWCRHFFSRREKRKDKIPNFVWCNRITWIIQTNLIVNTGKKKKKLVSLKEKKVMAFSVCILSTLFLFSQKQVKQKRTLFTFHARCMCFWPVWPLSKEQADASGHVTYPLSRLSEFIGNQSLFFF